MAYAVSEETKSRTTKCLFNVQCLNSDMWETCSIDRELQKDFLTIRSRCNKSYCLYCTSFASSYYCTCPTRREIYLTYRR